MHAISRPPRFTLGFAGPTPTRMSVTQRRRITLGIMSTPAETPIRDPSRQLLRHTVATLAYRCGKTLRDAPAGFANYRASEKTRTPGEILAHIGDLLDWGLSIAKGQQAWRNSAALDWSAEVQRFFSTLEAFDAYLASGATLHVPAEKLFQGPIADALTHTGQLAMLRRMAGAAVRGENYFEADIAAGRVGAEQSAPRREFD